MILAVFRSIILGILIVLISVIGCIACIFKPKHRDNVNKVARWFGLAHKVLGVNLVLRPKEKNGPCVYTSNHQNNYDIFIQTNIVPKGTVSIGKKSLIWLPFFGQIYYLSGNIFIDRSNRSSAINTLAEVAVHIKQKKLSIWLFPEGTRSRGRGLLPFKTGAFYTAIEAKVPIVPVISSDQTQIRLGKWNNGTVIVEILDPIPTIGLDKSDAKELAKKVHDIMSLRLDELNKEAQKLGEQSGYKASTKI